MSLRVTNEEVKKIIKTSLIEEEIAPHIEAANALVTDLLSSEEYGADRLRHIELWLAAHIVAMTDQQVTEEKIGDATQKYGGRHGLGLDYTRFGQMVKLLDHHGVLANASEAKRPAVIKVLEILS